MQPPVPPAGEPTVDHAATLHAAIESGLDGIVVVSAEGEMVTMNRKFIDMWGFPAEVVASRDDNMALQSVLDKLVDPDEFLRGVHAAYANPTRSTRDLLLLNDGRSFDRFGCPLLADGDYLGWAWYFRDVTDWRDAIRERDVDARRLAGLVAVAQALGGAMTHERVLEEVSGRGVAVLGARGAVLCRTDRDGALVRAWTTTFFGDDVRNEVAELPLGFPLPMIDTAVHGQAHFFVDRDAAVGAFRDAAALYDSSGTNASAAVPLLARGEVIGSLSVAFDAPHEWRPADRDLLTALASLTAQALDRIDARNAESVATANARRMSETLQRSLLTVPPLVAGLDIVVRYQPAVRDAQVGGDWYDAFNTPDGATTLVIGDVVGHDQDAAAAMAQVRSVLRGVAQTVVEPPAVVLEALDRALETLHTDVLATAVLCQVEPAPFGGMTLKWSAAGHLPPLLIVKGREPELLTSEPDLLLGMDSATRRTGRERDLPSGATLVLYTDGLIERRGESIDQGLDRLLAVGDSLCVLPADTVAEQLLQSLITDPEDDVAVLVLRVH